MKDQLSLIKEYYGKILKGSKDLKTNACCTTDSMPLHLREILKEIHPDVQNKFYGCGSPTPSELDQRSVLDLGSGSGRDCFLMSKLVGQAGHVIGVDMTREQLESAQQHVDFHTRQFGYSKSNIEFREGYIEDLESIGIKNNSIDVVTSNCVINLSPNKNRVFSEIFRVLKPGGELYFSDVFAARRVPTNLTSDPVLLGECLGGALYTEDFRRLLFDLGCRDYRIVSQSKIAMNNPEIERTIGMIDFYSITVRAFKLDLEDRCEDYGQVAYYLGTLKEHPHSFRLDDHHVFKTGMPFPICGNTASMLTDTRYARHFRIEGDRSIHYGLFQCEPSSHSKDPLPGACC